MKEKYYNDAGEEIPSVTQILKLLNKPALLQWANSLGKKGKTLQQGTEYAIAVGTCLHHRIECFAKGTKLEFGAFAGKREIAKSGKLFQDFMRYLEERKGKIVASEVRLISDKYGGTLDLIVNCDGKEELWDAKTSSDIWPEYNIQVVAYRILWWMKTGKHATPRVVLLPKEGKLRAPDITEQCQTICNEIWSLLVPLWHARQKLDNIL